MSLVGDLRDSRGLLVNLTLREVRGKYKRTLLGQGWSLLNPIANNPITSMKPTTPARSITLNGTGLPPRSFSTAAQKIWPPSSGRNGNRFTIASDSEMIARIPTASAMSSMIRLRVVS